MVEPEVETPASSDEDGLNHYYCEDFSLYVALCGVDLAGTDIIDADVDIEHDCVVCLYFVNSDTCPLCKTSHE